MGHPEGKDYHCQIKEHSLAKYTNAFLRAQRGLFLSISHGDQLFQKNGAWPTFDDVILELSRLSNSTTTVMKKFILSVPNCDRPKKTIGSSGGIWGKRAGMHE